MHGDVTTMMVGGIAALLLQMLHPGVLSGVWDHSNFRGDMLGRLRRTARFISITTYAGRKDAEAAIAKVRAIPNVPALTSGRPSDEACSPCIRRAQGGSRSIAAWKPIAWSGSVERLSGWRPRIRAGTFGIARTLRWAFQ
jgi:hypothetical protein